MWVLIPSQDLKINRNTVFIVISIVGLVGSLLTYSIYTGNDISKDIVKVKVDLNQDLSKVKSILDHYPTFTTSDKEILNESNWYLNILENDSLVYWNRLDLSPLEPKESGYQGMEVQTSPDNKIKYLLIPNIYDSDGHIKYEYGDKLNLKNKLKLPPQVNRYDLRSIDQLSSTAVKLNRIKSVIRYAFFLLFLTILLHGIYTYSYSITNDTKAIIIHTALSLITLLVLRFIDISQYFQPLVFHQIVHDQSWFTPTLADLLSMIITSSFWVMSTAHRLRSVKIHIRYNNLRYILSSFILGSGVFYFCHLASGVIRNSRIHLDIDNILLFDKYSFLVVILLTIYILLLFNLVCSILLTGNERVHKTPYKSLYYGVGLLLSFVFYYYLGLSLPLWILITYMVVYLLMIDLFLEHRSNSIIWLIWWMVIFASFLAGVVFYNSLSKDIDLRKSFVENLYQNATQQELLEITHLHQSVMKSGLFSLLSQLQGGKLERRELESYLNQNISFDELLPNNNFKIECYDASNTTLFSTYGIPFDQLQAQLSRSIQISKYISYNPYNQNFYLQYNVNNDLHDRAPFHLNIIINRKEKNKEQNQTQNFYVTKDSKIILMEDLNTQELNLDQIANIHRDTIIDGYSFVTHEVEQIGIRIINYKRISAIIKPVSLFSYIFSLLGILIIVISICNSRWKFLSEPLNIQLYTKDSLRTKIQLVIIVLIVFSFLIIGLMTGYYFNNLLKNNQSKVYREQILSTLNSINSYLKTAPDEESALLILDKSLKEISDIHQKNLTVYNRAGQMVSFTDINESMLRLPPDYSDIRLQSKDITYQNMVRTIVPLEQNTDKPYAYFTIAFPEKSNSYSSILDFISTILNVYVFLFLLAGAIALAIANSITRPLSVIAGKLKEFKLGASNEPLQYDGKDEIGQLIDEYNNLIVQVQDSADIIAKTERDMAWREMAKQVAHEIKNPLTPMKLSVQYLDKMVKTNPDRALDITQKVASTLVNQIDALTNIANEFSNYATMPKASNEKIVLNEIVEAVHDLFRKRDDMDITMSEPIADLKVFVDRNQLLRILNNLVKNAIQAIPDSRRGKVQISLSTTGTLAIIKVTDNGTGIPDYMKQKVFTPNFTTKNSGTGLGLAISANMIDSMNGRIYFDTEVDKGTTFYVEIPLVRSDHSDSHLKRVSLDD